MPDPLGIESDDFLRRLTEDEAASLERVSQRRSFARGDTLFRQGDGGEEVFVIRSGRVKVCVRWGRREVILAVMDAGSLLGELSAVDGQPRSATAIALEDVQVDVTSQTDFDALLEQHPRVATELLRLVARRLRDTSHRQLEFGTMDTLGRLCASLTELAARYGETAVGPAARLISGASQGLATSSSPWGPNRVANHPWRSGIVYDVERETARHIPGGLPERPKGADCKSVGIAYEGSNPSPATARQFGP